MSQQGTVSRWPGPRLRDFQNVADAQHTAGKEVVDCQHVARIHVKPACQAVDRFTALHRPGGGFRHRLQGRQRGWGGRADRDRGRRDLRDHLRRPKRILHDLGGHVKFLHDGLRGHRGAEDLLIHRQRGIRYIDHVRSGSGRRGSFSHTSRERQNHD